MSKKIFSKSAVNESSDSDDHFQRQQDTFDALFNQNIKRHRDKSHTVKVAHGLIEDAVKGNHVPTEADKLPILKFDEKKIKSGNINYLKDELDKHAPAAARSASTKIRKDPPFEHSKKHFPSLESQNKTILNNRDANKGKGFTEIKEALSLDYISNLFNTQLKKLPEKCNSICEDKKLINCDTQTVLIGNKFFFITSGIESKKFFNKESATVSRAILVVHEVKTEN